MGGSKSGKSSAFAFLEKQAYGQVLLGILAASLLCYAIWRFIQSLSDPENIGSDAKAKAKRAGFFLSALFYLSFAFLAVKKIVSSGSSGGSGGSKLQGLDPTIVTVVLAIIGVGMAVKAIIHFVQAYKGKFLDKYRVGDLKMEKFVRKAGYIGFYARSAVMAILSFIFFRAAFGGGSKEMKGTKEAFSFLQDSSYGTILMGVTAAGLAAYGLFVLALSRYRKFDG
jgi:uncharacterized membrane protein YidH (DUF202 family)